VIWSAKCEVGRECGAWRGGIAEAIKAQGLEDWNISIIPGKALQRYLSFLRCRLVTPITIIRPRTIMMPHK
jgi:hypothetical protein